MIRAALAFLRDRSGHIAIEYGMIASLIIILLISAISSMGPSVESMFVPLQKAIGAPKV